MPIYVFEGRLGQGKTWAMTLLGWCFSTAAGLPAYANYAVNFAKPLRSLDHLYSLENAVVMIDEFQVNMDSRSFASDIQREFTQFVLQSRKAGLIILGTTQRIHQVDKRLRGVVDLLISCSLLGSIGNYATELTYHEPISEEEFAPYGSVVIDHEAWMYELYDTYQRVRALESEKIIKGRPR